MRIHLSPVAAFVAGALLFVATAFAPMLWLRAGLPIPEFMGPTANQSLLLVVVLALMVTDRRRWGEFGIRAPRATFLDWVIGIVLGGLCGAAAVVLINVTPARGMWELMRELPLWMVPVLLWVTAPLTEELFVRGLVMTWMERQNERTVSLGVARVPVPALVGAVLFGAMHLILIKHGIDGCTVAIIVCMTFMLGLVTGYYRVRTQSLLIPLAAHVAYNVAGPAVGIAFAVTRKLLENSG